MVNLRILQALAAKAKVSQTFRPCGTWFLMKGFLYKIKYVYRRQSINFLCVRNCETLNHIVQFTDQNGACWSFLRFLYFQCVSLKS